jgi:hypothetical protein
MQLSTLLLSSFTYFRTICDLRQEKFCNKVLLVSTSKEGVRPIELADVADVTHQTSVCVPKMQHAGREPHKGLRLGVGLELQRNFSRGAGAT